jgi:acid phosphatase type 7
MTDPGLPDGSGPSRVRPGLRQAILGGFAFAATLVILVGLAAVVQGGGAGPGPTGQGHAGSASAAAPTSPSASAVASEPIAGSARPVSPSLATSSDPILIGAGDIADCDRRADSETASLLAGQDGFVFTAGDNTYPDGTAAQFTDCYGPTWGREVARTRPAPGNHDHATADLAGYLGYFGTAAAPEGTAWYSYEVGSWHVIVLDATCAAAGGCSIDSPQGRWLAADLAASSARCTLAIWHQPRFSSGEHGNDVAVAPFWDQLFAAGADVVVNGHDHDYERFAPQDPAGIADPLRGMREFVVGTGGAELRDFRPPVANSELRVAGYYGVIRLVLHPAAYEWSFLTTSGAVLDAGLGMCHQ